jgi:uncharacterized membrane protein
VEASLPDSFYYAIGVLFVMSTGAIVSAIGLVIKFSFSIGEHKAENRQMRKDINAAHDMIRELKEKQKGE